MLNLSHIDALIKINDGFVGQTCAVDRNVLYKCRLIEKDASGYRVVTERGKVFLGMLSATPLPVEVKTPRYVDPREKR